MATQVVRPAGAGHETLWVLLGVALIVAAAAAAIAWRVGPAAAVHAAGEGIDARFELNAAEQGLHADLRVAAEEVATLITENKGTPPTPEALAALALPPFVAPPGGDTRGAHRWQPVLTPGFVAYLGTPAQPEKAGALLLRLPAAGNAKAPERDEHGHDAAPAQVWLHRTAAAPAPTALDDSTLRRLGWQPVLSRFDAGVTRRQPH